LDADGGVLLDETLETALRLRGTDVVSAMLFSGCPPDDLRVLEVTLSLPFLGVRRVTLSESQR
jgi:hypothetical protein